MSRLKPRRYHRAFLFRGLEGGKLVIISACRGSSSSRAADIEGEIHPRILVDLDLRQGVAHLRLRERGTAAVERQDHSDGRW